MKLLCFGSSPIIKVYMDEFGNDIYMMREDLIPFSFGGNKVRIALEYLNDAISKKCDIVIGYGSPNSNLIRVLSNLCAASGMPIINVVCKDADQTEDCVNLILSKLCGGEIVLCEKSDVRASIEKVMRECIIKGLKPYYIYGDSKGEGNKEIPLRAYRKVYKDLMEFEKTNRLLFDSIFLPVGTGMTYSGLIVGRDENDNNKKIVGISISRNRNVIIDTVNKNLYCYDLIYKRKKQDNNHLMLDESISIISDDYLAGGYGKANESIKSIIKSFYNKYSIPLDTTYSGKALWGMTKFIQDNNIKNERILFIHTGGTPLFFQDIYCKRSILY